MHTIKSYSIYMEWRPRMSTLRFNRVSLYRQTVTAHDDLKVATEVARGH
jgi:hypothetical protein